MMYGTSWKQPEEDQILLKLFNKVLHQEPSGVPFFLFFYPVSDCPAPLLYVDVRTLGPLLTSWKYLQ